MSEIKGKYRGVEITYEVDKNLWHILDSDQGMDCTRESLKAARKYIDGKLDKTASKSARIPCFMTSDFKEAIITSLSPSYYYDGVWISYEEKQRNGKMKKERKKESVARLYEDNPVNRELIAKIKTLLEKEVVLAEERRGYLNKMRHVQFKDVQKAFSEE
ncbi:MAG: hypothetical protein ABR999_10965 [Methanoregula sp.]|jgi:hypothetical protein|uniref:hypothetical protein n=1 Tax=Methanoregula sp. TaxID=2052170 RepID=UPI003D0DFDF1